MTDSQSEVQAEWDAATAACEALFDGLTAEELGRFIEEAFDQGNSTRFEIVAFVDSALGNNLLKAHTA